MTRLQLSKLIGSVALGAIASAASAEDAFVAITTAVSFAGVIAAMGLVAAGIAGVKVWRRGADAIMGMIGKG